MRKRIDEGRRPDRRDVAAQGQPAAALRAARPRARRPEARRAAQQPLAPLGELSRLAASRRSGRRAFASAAPGPRCSASASLSGRKRMNFVPCRKRLPSSLSKRTSTTSSGRTGFQSSSLPRDQRLWPPGIRLSLSFPGASIFGSSASSSRRTGGREAGAVPDEVERAVVGVEAEQQRRDPPVGLVAPAEADDHAVGGLVRLHLDHAVARARQVRQLEPLRDHAVEPRLLEPVEPASPPASGRRVAGESRNFFAFCSSSRRRFFSGSSWIGLPFQTSRSKAT